MPLSTLSSACLRRLLGLAVLLWPVLLSAQGRQVTGTVRDSVDAATLPGAAVVLIDVADTLVRRSTVTDVDGRFHFGEVQQRPVLLRVEFLGYGRVERPVPAHGDVIDLDLRLAPASNLLRTFDNVALQMRVEQKGDTTVYHADAFKVNKDATAEDLVTKMPGIANDGGTIKAQGEAVKRVTVDGQEFFGDDATMTLKNLPAEIVDKVQVFDKLSDQAQFTGFDDGSREKTLNITTKAGRNNGVFGKASAGAGTDERYAAALTLNWFRGKERISLLGQTNNINQQSFSAQDLVSTVGGGRGGRGGAPALLGQQAGINTTDAIGLNYSDQLGKTRLSGSYFYNAQRAVNASNSDRTTFLNDTTTRTSLQSSDRDGRNSNHRFNLRVEYTIDSMNSIIITPRAGVQDNATISTQLSDVSDQEGALSRSSSTTSSDRNGYDISNDLLFRHRYAKPRRTFTARIGTVLNGQESTGALQADNSFFGDSSYVQRIQQRSTGSNSTGTHTLDVNHTEPVGKQGIVQLSIVPSLSESRAEKLTYDLDADSASGVLNTRLSNRADNTVRALRGGISYRWNSKKFSFNVGVDGQRSDMHSEQTYPYTVNVDRTFAGVLPNAMLQWSGGPRTRLRANYRTSLQTPSITRLQNVVDNSDPLRLSTGNLDLEQSVQHNLTVRLNTVDSTRTRPFFTLLSVQAEPGRVSNATYAPLADSTLADGTLLPAGAQLTRPVNLDGYWSMRTLVNYGFPVLPIKCNLNVNAGASYELLPGSINATANRSRNLNWNVGALVSSNVSKQVDFRLGYTANFNTATNDLQLALDNRYYQGKLIVKLTLRGLGGWVFDSEVNYDQYVGLGAGFDQDAFVWNAAVAHTFLQNDALELRLTAYDLLGRNVSVTRTVSETYVENTSTTMLQRYFLLTLSFNLRAFKGIPEERAPELPPGAPRRERMLPPDGMHPGP